jgi:hypothetical protein
MKRIFGGLLMLAGAFCLYLFATRAMFQGRASMGSTYDMSLPLMFVGMDYPTDALFLAGALWGFILGLWFVITGATDSGDALRGGRIARVMLLNGLLLFSTLAVAFIGARHHKDATTVAVFGLVALAQAAFGLILLVLSLFERPKGIASLAFGAVVYLGGLAVGVLAVLGGRGA